MGVAGLSVKYHQLPCLYNWLTGKGRGVKVRFMGAKGTTLSNIAFPREVFEDLLKRAHKNIAGGGTINFHLPYEASRQALEELISGLEMGDKQLQVEDNGDIKLVPASTASLSSAKCLVLGNAEVLNKTGLTSEAQAALPDKSVLIVGNDSHRLYSKNELLQCRLCPELPVFSLGTKITSLEQVQGKSSINFDQLIFLLKRFSHTSVLVKPVLIKLAACFQEGFDAFYELDSLYTGKWKRTYSFESVFCFALRQLVKELSKENLILFLAALQENNCWEALAFVEEHVLSPLQKKDLELAEVLACGFLDVGHLSKASQILNAVPEQTLPADAGKVKGKKAKGKKHKRAKVHPLAALVAKVRTIDIAQRLSRTEHMFDAFDRLCRGEIDLEGFDKLRLQVIIPKEGGRVFTIPWTAKRAAEERDYKSDLEELKRHFFESFDPENPDLFDKVMDFAKKDYLFYDLQQKIVEQVYAGVVKGEGLTPKEGKLLSLILPLARETREFLPTPKTMLKIHERETSGNLRFKKAQEVFKFLFTEVYKEAEIKEGEGKFEEAWECYQRAYEVLPEHEKLEERMVSFLRNWSRVLFIANKIELMDKINRILLGFRPNDIKAKLSLIYSACQQGNHDEAISMGKELEIKLEAELLAEKTEVSFTVEQKPRIISQKEQELQETLTNLGNAYIMKNLVSGDGRDLNKALEYLDRAAKINPQYPALNYYRALAYATAGKLEKSLNCLDILIKNSGVTVMPLLLIFNTLLSLPSVAAGIKEERLLHFIEMVDSRHLKNELLQRSPGECRVAEVVESKIKESIRTLREGGFDRASDRMLLWYKEIVDSNTREKVFDEFAGVNIPLRVAVANSYITILTEIDVKRAIAEAERIVGREQKPSPVLLNILANLYLGSGRNQEAFDLSVRALKNQTIPFRVYPLFNLARSYRALGNREGYVDTLKLLAEVMAKEVTTSRQGQFKNLLYYIFLLDEDNQTAVLVSDWEKLNSDRSQEFFVALSKGKNPFIDRETGDIAERFTGEILPQDLDIACSEAEAAALSKMLCEVQEWSRQAQPVIDGMLNLLSDKFPERYAQALENYQDIVRPDPKQALPPINRLGEIYLQEADYARALEKFNKVLRLRGEELILFPEVDLNLLTANIKSGNIEGAGSALFSLAAAIGRAKMAGRLGELNADAGAFYKGLQEAIGLLSLEQGMELEPYFNPIISFLKSNLK
jgi:tetratricopeptide (TPR) repeat protein